ncbi:alpha-1A adrenergic receptor-like [Mytilus trossulus]|uniref:alpha-1A adrenergic receptor-like n=1 Tax=Mytilus trossulus TaxID=6551 RepID=UPI0030078B2B
MISSWVVCLVICQAPLFGWNQDTSEEYCRYFGVFTKNFLLLYCAIMYMMSFMVFLMYCHILCIAFKQNNRIRREDHRQINKQHTHIWWKPTKTAMIIVGINVVSWLPSGIFAVLVTTDHLDDLSLGQKGTILTYISSVIYLNCIANPLIYACKIKKVSRFLRKLFKVREHVTYVTEYDLKPESGEQLIEKEVNSITNR